VEPRRRFNGCSTCEWFNALPKADQKAFKEWAEQGWSLRQLHRICATDEQHPLGISLSAMKNHIRDCMEIHP